MVLLALACACSHTRSVRWRHLSDASAGIVVCAVIDREAVTRQFNASVTVWERYDSAARTAARLKADAPEHEDTLEVLLGNTERHISSLLEERVDQELQRFFELRNLDYLINSHDCQLLFARSDYAHLYRKSSGKIDQNYIARLRHMAPIDLTSEAIRTLNSDANGSFIRDLLNTVVRLRSNLVALQRLTSAP
jgi:hypothetical protein